jgi:hypothetical protein
MAYTHRVGGIGEDAAGSDAVRSGQNGSSTTCLRHRRFAQIGTRHLTPRHRHARLTCCRVGHSRLVRGAAGPCHRPGHRSVCSDHDRSIKRRHSLRAVGLFADGDSFTRGRTSHRRVTCRGRKHRPEKRGRQIADPFPQQSRSLPADGSIRYSRSRGLSHNGAPIASGAKPRALTLFTNTSNRPYVAATVAISAATCAGSPRSRPTPNLRRARPPRPTRPDPLRHRGNG